MANLDFITQFYNLEGDTISERKKNFFKLLKAQSVSLTEEYLEDLHPRTYLENLFQIDIFLHFKIYKKLLDVLKGGNEVYISKVLKHPLIMKEAIGNVSPQELVNDFIPCVSYAMRMKILKRMSFFLDESQMDEIVFWVYKRYGIYEAKRIIHTCSSQFIEDFVISNNIILKPSQVKFIFDKDTELFLIYLSHYKLLTGNVFKHDKICRYIASKNPKLWLRIQSDKTMSVTRLGCRTTKHFVKHHINIINDFKFYSNFLNINVMVRKLNGNFNQVYYQLFPRNMKELYATNFCNTLLKYYPKNKRWDMFVQTFFKVFEVNILDNLIHLNDSFLDFFPNATIMKKWAEAHYDGHNSELLEYFAPDKAIPLLKEKINVTSDVSERTAFICLLLSNCAQNQDMVALEMVLQYICFRHRNEENLVDIIYHFRRRFEWNVLNKNHWKYLNEIIEIFRLKNDSIDNIKLFMTKYIEFLFLNEESFTAELLTFVQYFQTIYIHFDNVDTEKHVLAEIIKLFSIIQERNTNLTIKNLVLRVIEFNKSHHEYAIDLSDVPNAHSCIQAVFNKNLYALDVLEKRILNTVVEYNFEFPENPIIVLEDTKILEIFQHTLNPITSLLLNFHLKN